MGKLLANCWAISLFIAVNFLILPSQSFAGPKWASTKEIVTETKDGIFKGRVFSRFIQTKKHAFDIGTITYISAPKSNEFKSTSEMAHKTLAAMKKAMGIKKWVTRRYYDAYVAEGMWEKGNRLVRLFFWQEGEQLSYSVAMFRKTYAELVYFETEVFQRLLARKHYSVKTVDILDYINPISKAYAQDTPCGCNPGDFLCLAMCTANGNSGNRGDGGGILPDLLGGGTDLTGIQGELETLNDNLETTNGNHAESNIQWGVSNQNWGETNNQLNGFNANWADSNENWGVSNDLWEQSNQQFNEFTNIMNTNWQESNENWAESNQILDTRMGEANEIVDRRWGETNQIMDTRLGEANEILDRRWGESNEILDRQMTRANDLVEKMLDPKHAFMLAASSAAGAAVGVLAVNLAVKGIAFTAKKLVQLFTGNFDETEALERFQAAREAYEKLSHSSLELEKALGVLPLLHEIPTMLGRTREGVIYGIDDLQEDIELNRLELDYTNEQKRAAYQRERREGRSHACSKSLIRRALNIESTIANQEKVANFLRRQDQEGDHFCENLSNLWRNYVSAESTLQNLRRVLVNPRNKEVFERAKQAQLEQAREDMEDINSRRHQENYREAQEDIAEDNRKDAKKELKRTKRRLVNLCANALYKNTYRIYRHPSARARRDPLSREKKNCEHLMSEEGRAEYEALGRQYNMTPYDAFLHQKYPRTANNSRKRMKKKYATVRDILSQELQVMGRETVFTKWQSEIDSAYEANIAGGATRQEQFQRVFTDDLMRVNEELHVYELNSFRRWFEEIQRDMIEREKSITEKLKGRQELYQRLCPEINWLTLAAPHR